MAYVFTGLWRPAYGEGGIPDCSACSGTGICPECGVLPEGTDCGLCGRNTPKYACEQCWPWPCDECSGTGCADCGGKGNKVTRVGPVAWDGSQVDTNLCRDCGGMGYTDGCGECGRVTVPATVSGPATEGVCSLCGTRCAPDQCPCVLANMGFDDGCPDCKPCTGSTPGGDWVPGVPCAKHAPVPPVHCKCGAAWNIGYGMGPVDSVEAAEWAKYGGCEQCPKGK